MSRGVLLRLLLVIGLLGGATAIAVNKEPELGLDLRGGAQFIFEVQPTEDTPATAENVDRTLEVLRGRVDSLGVTESTLVRQGEDRILVELPGITDEERAAEAEERIGQTAQLSVHPVIATVPDAKTKPSKEGNLVLPSDQGDVLELGPAALQGDEITGAESAQPQDSTAWVVNVDFSGEGSDAFGKLSAEAACAQGAKNRIAIVLDERVISSPGVEVPCGGSITRTTQISG
ncbi:MAG TPA: protein translocase subunit SecD, partial [Nocardioides sp.]|nr:protein translocase subunit SecD [Nocardioides sp.]